MSESTAQMLIRPDKIHFLLIVKFACKYVYMRFSPGKSGNISVNFLVKNASLDAVSILTYLQSFPKVRYFEHILTLARLIFTTPR